MGGWFFALALHRRVRESLANMDEKTHRFITLVQTGLILHHVKSTPQPASAYWAMDQLNDAYDVAGRIPNDVSAGEAAEFFLQGAVGDKEQRAALPAWLAHE
jgi:hypothetical protein